MTDFEQKQWAKIIRNAKRKAKQNDEVTKDWRKQKRSEATRDGSKDRSGRP